MLGWGAVSQGSATGGRWALEELAHINVLELKAVLLGLQSLCRGTHSNILVKTDNTTVADLGHSNQGCPLHGPDQAYSGH